jgi:hypothetical protein
MIPLPEAMVDPNLFEPWFGGESWDGWRTILKAAFAQPLTTEELAQFHILAGEREPPQRRVRELWVVAGRRAGKDSIASLIGVYAAAFTDYRPLLRPGERAVVLIIACDRPQARVALNYARALFTEIPLLHGMIERETQDGFELRNGAEISVFANNFRSVRGRSLICAVLSEVAFYRDDSSSTPDRETYNALTPAMATLSDSLLVGISSPYKKAGLLFEKWRDYFGKDSDDVLVIHAPSKTLNPTLSQEAIDRAFAEDPVAAAAEFGAEWRTDISGLFDRAMVEAAIETGRLVRPPIERIYYRAFADPSGGQGDAFTLGIAHREGSKAVLDVLYERRPPFSPPAVVREIADILRRYRLTTVIGDRYSAQWVVAAFAEQRIQYRHSERDRSSIYLDALPLFTSGEVALLDNRRLVAELVGLERRVSIAGRDAINHQRNQHDDLANACCGALVEAVGGRQPMRISPAALELASRPEPRRWLL